MGRLIHFEITADVPDRAVAFYQKALGWKIEKYPGGGVEYWLITTGPEGTAGINGAIMGRLEAGQSMVNTVSVENLEEAMLAVRRAGGKADGRIDDIPNVGRFTYAIDTEGNMLGLLQEVRHEH